MLRLAWKNICHRPLSLLLNILLLSLGVGLISFLVKVNDQLKEQFDSNLANIDLVIGAKGSPLQMILCSMYHIDNPTGNISVEEATPYLRPNHPLIKQAVPLSLGDSYQGYRIVGTEPMFVDLYKGKLSEGSMFAHTNEVIVGVTAATIAKLEIGSTFKSSHGFVQDDDMSHDHSTLKVVGLLEKSGSVLDQLILTPTSSVWAAHDHEEEPVAEHEDHDHSDHDHDHEHDHDHDHDHDHAHHDHHVHDISREDLLSHPEKEITSILVQYKSKTNMHALNLPRSINNNTDMMAASPPMEINRLYSMMGVGTKVLQALAMLIAFVSSLSIFISLLNSLKERAYELSLIRVLGASPPKLFMLLIFEGLLLAFIGAIIGLLLSRVALYFLSDYMGTKYRYDFVFGIFDYKDLIILFISLGIGILAALLPAMRAYRTDIHETLGNR